MTDSFHSPGRGGRLPPLQPQNHPSPISPSHLANVSGVRPIIDDPIPDDVVNMPSPRAAFHDADGNELFLIKRGSESRLDIHPDLLGSYGMRTSPGMRTGLLSAASTTRASGDGLEVEDHNQALGRTAVVVANDKAGRNDVTAFKQIETNSELEQQVKELQAQVARLRQVGLVLLALVVFLLLGAASLAATYMVREPSVSIRSQSIGSEQLRSDAVTGENIQSNSINSGHLQSRSVLTRHIAFGAVTESELAAAAVTSASLAQAAVTADKIARGQVTATALADGAVTGIAIAEGQVAAGKLAPDVAGSGLRLAADGSLAVRLGPVAAGGLEISDLGQLRVSGLLMAAVGLGTNESVFAGPGLAYDKGLLSVRAAPAGGIVVNSDGVSVNTTALAGQGLVADPSTGALSLSHDILSRALPTATDIAGASLEPDLSAPLSGLRVRVRHAGIGAAQLAPLSVNSSHLSIGSVLGAHILNGSVDSSKLAAPLQNLVGATEVLTRVLVADADADTPGGDRVTLGRPDTRFIFARPAAVAQGLNTTISGQDGGVGGAGGDLVLRAGRGGAGSGAAGRVITQAGGASLSLGGEAGSLVASADTVAVIAGDSLALSSVGGGVDLTAAGDVSLQSGSRMTLSGQELSLTASGALSVTGQANVSVAASETLVLHGRAVRLAADEALNITGRGPVEIRSEDATAVTAAGPLRLASAQKLELAARGVSVASAAGLNLSAAAGVVIAAANGSISMSASGSVTVGSTAADVRVTAGRGDATVDSASGTATLSGNSSARILAGGDVKIASSAGSVTVAAAADVALTAHRNLNFTVDGDASLRASGASGIRLDATSRVSISAAEAVSVASAGVLSLGAEDLVSISSANDSVVVSSPVSITLNAPKIIFSGAQQQSHTDVYVDANRTVLIDFANLTARTVRLLGAPGSPVELRVANCDERRLGIVVTVINAMRGVGSTVTVAKRTCNDQFQATVGVNKTVVLSCHGTNEQANSAQCTVQDDSGVASASQTGYGTIQLSTPGNVTLNADRGLLVLKVTEVFPQNQYLRFTFFNNQITPAYVGILFTFKYSGDVGTSAFVVNRIDMFEGYANVHVMNVGTFLNTNQGDIQAAFKLV